MGLNRGYMCLKPCPICLVPHDQMHDLIKTWDLCSSKKTQQIINQARSLNYTEGEQLLKDNGIRDVDACFNFSHVSKLSCTHFTLYCLECLYDSRQF